MADWCCAADSPLPPGEPMLLVEDVITKGGRVPETKALVASRTEARSRALVDHLVDRSDGGVQLGVPLFSCLL